MFQPVHGLCSCGWQFSSGGGLLPVKTVWECESGLYIFKGAVSLVILLFGRFYSLTDYPVLQPNGRCVFLYLHISQLITLESAFYFKKLTNGKCWRGVGKKGSTLTLLMGM